VKTVLVVVIVALLCVLLAVGIAFLVLVLFPPPTTIHLNGNCQDLYKDIGKGAFERVRVCP
jgi:hypothetical protein